MDANQIKELTSNFEAHHINYYGYKMIPKKLTTDRE